MSADVFNVLRKELADLLAHENVPHSAANSVTEQFIARFRQRFGGERLYIPEQDPNTIAQRDEAILQDLNASIPPTEIARRHGVDRATVYRVYHRRTRRRPEDDGGFGSDDWNLR